MPLLAWIIVLLLLLLLLILPVGVDFRYDGAIALKLKLGPIRVGLLPKAEKPASGKAEAKPDPKPKKEKVKTPKSEKKLRLNKDDIFTLLKTAFRALGRFRRHLSIDRLELNWLSAAEDPYDAVMQFGWLNAGLHTLMPYVHEVLKIRGEDIRTAVDLELKKPQITAAVTATLQIWEILLIGFCAVGSVLKWYLKKKKQERAGRRKLCGAERN